MPARALLCQAPATRARPQTLPLAEQEPTVRGDLRSSNRCTR